MRILRHSVPVDDREHRLTCGTILYIDCRDIRQVEVWADEDAQATPRVLRVFGTGQPIPEGWVHRGTALSPPLAETPRTRAMPRGALVWHLCEREEQS